MPANVTTSAVPPNDTSGSGTPVMGRTPVTAPRFTIVCRPIHAVTPAARNRPNVSGARTAMRIAGEQQQSEHHQDEERPEESQLLADDREDEVGVGVGQVVPLLAAGAQARRPSNRPSPARSAPGSAGTPSPWGRSTGSGTNPRSACDGRPRRTPGSPRPTGCRTRSRPGSASVRPRRTSTRTPTRRSRSWCPGRAAVMTSNAKNPSTGASGMTRCLRSSILRHLFASTVAAKATSPSFRNSAGWIVIGPRSIHRDAPYRAVP